MDLYNLLNERYKQCDGENGKNFISLEDLHGLITEQRVEEHLRSNKRLDRRFREIIPIRPRLFAILVLLEREENLNAILEHIPDDSFVYSNEEDVPQEIGNRDQRADFFDRQSHFPPPLTRDFPPRIFPATFRPPLVDRADEIRHGAYGIVRRVKVAKGHLPEHHPVRLRPRNRIGLWLTVEQDGNEYLAWKSIETSISETTNETREEVKTSKNRQHEHIVPLVACYETLARDTRSQTLHILFPWADQNMAEWIRRPINLGLPDEPLHRKEYLYDSILSILSALAYLHSVIDHTFASHHDLKPENILLFGKVWKICDFGKSHIRTLEEGSETSTKHLGTLRYQPPEYDNPNIKHGRAFDIWSTGCIIVELAFLIVYGWETQEWEKFTMEIENESRPVRDDRRRDKSFRSNMPVVTKWMEKLTREDGSRNFTYLMKITSAMLSQEREARPYSWEVEIYLHEAFYSSEKGSDRRARIEKLVQPPPENFHGHNPLARAIYENNSDLKDCLQKNGWRLELSNEADPFDADSMSGAADVVSLLEDFRPSSSQITQTFLHELGKVEDEGEKHRRKVLAREFAKRLRSAQHSIFEIRAVLKRKYPMDLIRILAGEVDVNHMDSLGNTQLTSAARVCDVVAVDVLLRYDAEVDPVNARSETPLMIASKLGHTPVVQRLLQEPLEINLRDNHKQTSLFLAAQEGHYEVVHLLLDKGADPNLTDKLGRTPLLEADRWGI